MRRTRRSARTRRWSGQRLAPGTVRRIAAFARPYRAWIALFLVTVVIDAVLVVATPLLFKRIIDDGVTARRPRRGHPARR